MYSRYMIPEGTLVRRYFPTYKRDDNYKTVHDVIYEPGEYEIRRDIKNSRYDEFIVDLRRFGGDSILSVLLEKVIKL